LNKRDTLYSLTNDRAGGNFNSNLPKIGDSPPWFALAGRLGQCIFSTRSRL
jgi:hypothetical protein